MPTHTEDLETAARNALDAKIEIRESVILSPEELKLQLEQLAPSTELEATAAESLPGGTFEGLENIRLRWVAPNWFEFIPRSTTPFAFTRSSGERVEPRRMFTDGGSIPRLARWSGDLDPWGFAPAYLLHDWEFDVHHCGRSNKSFESVRDSMMEAVRTLMDMGLCPSSSIVFRMIYLGISSPFARRLWDAQIKDCPLPPDISENCKRFLPS